MSQEFKKIHFIAIGGSVMHNLAIALKNNGIVITGSDDHFYEPSLSNLKQHNILPEQEGWFAEKITTALDAVVVGMHAKENNSELIKAQELGLKIYSFPEFILEQSQNKQRVVIGGSHGKTTITSMIMHVLKENNKEFDYLVGAQLNGFDTMVQLSDAPVIVIEGDEYLTSPLDLTPKFLKYKHHTALISGISWDHANIFPTMEDYVKPFESFIQATPKSGSIIYNADDSMTTAICESYEDKDIKKFGYSYPRSEIRNEQTFIFDEEGKAVPLKIFGQHNLANLSAAKTVCNRLGITDKMFYSTMQSFVGAGKRLELMGEKNGVKVFKDFAHAPSKLAASINAVKEQYASKEVVALYELHTFSSFNDEFLSQYKDAFQDANQAILLLDDNVLASKGNVTMTDDVLKGKFNAPNASVIHNQEEFVSTLKSIDWNNKVLLVMSSGGLTGLSFDDIIKII